ncbi:putative Ig domain-containing protein [Roseivirga sp.]|uniref:putative Ig domain-containing protein n=1 Tax=Roseivirga sp. TaxID=1964215 RepID=UPI003B8E4683
MKYASIFLLVVFCACNNVQESNNASPYHLDQELPSDIPTVFGAGTISIKGRFDMGFAISPNGENIAFGVAHDADPNQTQIYLMSFSDGKWSKPNTQFLPDNRNTFFPMFSPQGDQFYFAKSVDNMPNDLWVADFKNNTISNPRKLDSLINSKTREAGHGKATSGAFYFTSNRNLDYACCGDIYKAEKDNQGQLNISLVEEINTQSDEESIFLSPDEDYMIIQSWQNEYRGKHDLYITYREKSGNWTVPIRLNENINGGEIEQRPFVSPGNKHLFFSRMSITQENGQDMFESDLYWVSAKTVFAPFVYNPKTPPKMTLNERFEWKIPSDLFKDIDDEILSLELSPKDASVLPEWLKFNKDEVSINGVWQSDQPLELTIKATDSAGNSNHFDFTLSN